MFETGLVVLLLELEAHMDESERDRVREMEREERRVHCN